MRKKLIIILALVILVSLSTTSVALGFWVRKTVTGQVAGIETRSIKELYFGQTTVNWYVISRTMQPVQLLGFTWWTCQRICPSGSYVVWRKLENWNLKNANEFSMGYHVYYQNLWCPGEPPHHYQTYGNLGNHEYLHLNDQQYPRNDLYFP
jgi:hypothetical protein